MKNLIAGLREYANSSLAPMYMNQAATAIEKLEAENAALKAELESTLKWSRLNNDAAVDMGKQCRELAAELEAREWQPIESAPKDGTDVIVMYMHIDTQIVHNAFYASEAEGWDAPDTGWWSYEHSEGSRIKLDDWMTPTHWVPLYAAPGAK